VTGNLPRLVGSVEHVEKVLGVGQALVGLAEVSAAGPVVSERCDGWHLTCKQGTLLPH